MERINNSIRDIKNDLKQLIYDLANLIGYVHMDFDKELPDEDFWDKQNRTELYQKANKFLEAINQATYQKEYGEISQKNIINELEAIYYRAVNKGKKPKDQQEPWINNENEEKEEEEEEEQ